MCGQSLQWCPILYNPMDCRLPGSSVHGILQARILEQVTMPFSRGFSQPRDQTCAISCLLHHRQIFDLRHPGSPIGKFIPRYLILFDAVTNGIVSLISLSDLWLFMCIFTLKADTKLTYSNTYMKLKKKKHRKKKGFLLLCI